MAGSQARPEQVAPGVYRLETGRGLTEANVYLVESGQAWVLIDAAWPHRTRASKSRSVLAPEARAVVHAQHRPGHCRRNLPTGRLVVGRRAAPVLVEPGHRNEVGWLLVAAGIRSVITGPDPCGVRGLRRMSVGVG